MGPKHTFVTPHRLESGTAALLKKAQRVCLAACAGLAFACLVNSVLPAHLRPVFAGMMMSPGTAVVTLAACASLALTRRRRRRGFRLVGAVLALAVIATALASLTLVKVGALVAGDTEPAMAPVVAVAFALLGTVALAGRLSQRPARYLVDTAMLMLGWIVLALVSADAYSMFRVFHSSPPMHVRAMTVAALALLTFVAFVRRARDGSFEIFMARGIGGRVARGLLPIIVLLPFFREVARARMTSVHSLPQHYAAAILSAFGTVISVLLLLWISNLFRRLEREIRDLSLRDELTGLYNLRGFLLLAEQSLRLSQRSHMPFSVLFVDVDNLKQINDQKGHAQGSRLLVETAEFLQTHFRDGDVVARIGGDEFAVAGHFSSGAIHAAEERLERQAESAPADLCRLSLSMGHVTADAHRVEKLQDLLDRADAAMYQQKRLKKLHA